MPGEGGAVGAGSSGAAPSGAAAKPAPQPGARSDQPSVNAQPGSAEGSVPENGGPATPQADDSLEIELDGGKKVKFKRDEAVARLSRSHRIESEATKQLQEVEQFWKQIGPMMQTIEQIKKNPMALFEFAKQTGVDPDAAARAYVEDYMKRQSMTPEQRKIFDLEQQLASAKKQAEDIQAQAQQAEIAAQEKAALDESVRLMSTSAQKYNMPKHPMALTLMSAFARAQVEEGKMPKPDFDQAAENVRDMAMDFSKSWLKSMKYADLVKDFPEVVKAVREGDLAASVGGRKPAPAQPKPGESRNGKPTTMAEARAEWLAAHGNIH